MWRKVQVKWADIVSHSDWFDIPKAKKLKPAICFTRGYLFHEDKDTVIIIGSYNLSTDDNLTIEQVSDITVIPKGCIIKINKG